MAADAAWRRTRRIVVSGRSAQAAVDVPVHQRPLVDLRAHRRRRAQLDAGAGGDDGRLTPRTEPLDYMRRQRYL